MNQPRNHTTTTRRVLKPVSAPTPPAQLAFSMGEVADMLGCCYDHVRREVRAGRLPHRRLGQRIFIMAVDLERLFGKEITQ